FYLIDSDSKISNSLCPFLSLPRSIQFGLPSAPQLSGFDTIHYGRVGIDDDTMRALRIVGRDLAVPDVVGDQRRIPHHRVAKSAAPRLLMGDESTAGDRHGPFARQGDAGRPLAQPILRQGSRPATLQSPRG